MSVRKIYFFICLIVSMLCLVSGYGVAGQWFGAVIAVIIGFAWLPARKYPDSGLPLICLAASVCLAVVGRLSGFSSLLMILGLGFALAAWDLVFLDNALGGNSLDAQTRQYESKHLQSLTLALSCGLTVATVGRLIHIQIPFIAMIFFVAVIIFGLERIWNAIKKRDVR